MMRNAGTKSKAIQIWIILSFLMGSFGGLAHAETEFVKYSDPKKSIKGDGSSDDPYQIAHPFHLKEMRDNLSSHFKLTRSLDLEENKNFKPIGGEKNPFEGTFDGAGKTIRNLKIRRPDEDGVGLFGWTGENAMIRNVGLEKIDIVGKHWVGGLVGVNFHKEITEAYFDAKAKSDAGKEGAWKEYRDIFEKRNRYGGKIEASYAAGKVEGKSLVGGLVGVNVNKGTIEASYATGKVEGERTVGGLVGWNHEGTIEASYAAGKVEGESSVGGLVGWNHEGTIEASYAAGKVEGEKAVGGLVGRNFEKGTIKTSYATGKVEGKGYYVGGLVGVNFGTIQTSYAAGKVNGKKNVGGFVGENYKDGRIEGKNYWRKGSAKKGVGKNEGEASQIRRKSKSQIYALIRRAWKNEKIWVFAPQKHPRLRWQSSL